MRPMWIYGQWKTKNIRACYGNPVVYVYVELLIMNCTCVFIVEILEYETRV